MDASRPVTPASKDMVGSNPTLPTIYIPQEPDWYRHVTVNHAVAGSSPAWGASFIAGSSNGRTVDSDSIGLGSNPSLASSIDEVRT